MARHRVVALALEPLVALDLAAPAHVFGHWGGERYSFRCRRRRRLARRYLERLRGGRRGRPGRLRRADTVVVPGYEGASRRPPEPVLRELRAPPAAGRA